MQLEQIITPLALIVNNDIEYYNLTFPAASIVPASDLQRRVCIMDACAELIVSVKGPDLGLQRQCSEHIKSLITDPRFSIEVGIPVDEVIKRHEMPIPPQFCTCTSGYWPMRNSKYNKFSYENWMNNTLAIDMPYIFFAQNDIFDVVLAKRKGRPTAMVEWNFSWFKTHATYSPLWFDDYHMPSPELGVIWLEKMNLIHETSKLVDSEYYVWIDATISFYRSKTPPRGPWSEKIIRSLPKNRISFSSVNGGFHSFAATVIIFPRDLVSLMYILFYREYDLCRNSPEADFKCGSEQYLFTRITVKHPGLFHVMSYNYGDIDFLW